MLGQLQRTLQQVGPITPRIQQVQCCGSRLGRNSKNQKCTPLCCPRYRSGRHRYSAL